MDFDSLYSRNFANSYFVKNNNFVIAVDPGDPKVIDFIIKKNYKIGAILLTHGHYDHICGLKELLKQFPDAEVYICEEEKEFLFDTKFNLFNENIFNDISEIRNLKTFFDNEIIEIDGLKIKCIHTPFHTKGSSCYFIEKENILFSGDTLFFSTIGRTDLPTGSNKTVEQSLKKLSKLPMETKIYPGHGLHTSIARELKYNPYLRFI